MSGAATDSMSTSSHHCRRKVEGVRNCDDAGVLFVTAQDSNTLDLAAPFYLYSRFVR